MVLNPTRPDFPWVWVFWSHVARVKLQKINIQPRWDRDRGELIQVETSHAWVYSGARCASPATCRSSPGPERDQPGARQMAWMGAATRRDLCCTRRRDRGARSHGIGARPYPGQLQQWIQDLGWVSLVSRDASSQQRVPAIDSSPQHWDDAGQSARPGGAAITRQW